MYRSVINQDQWSLHQVCAWGYTQRDLCLSTTFHPLRNHTINARMSSSHKPPGKSTRGIRPRDLERAGAAELASDNDQSTSLGEGRRSSGYLSGFESRQDEIRFLYNEPASVNTTVLRGRAFQIRDILSTFSRNDFPSEHVKANIFDRTAFLNEPKPITDCVEKEDLVSTIFLLAVNNSAQYSILRHVFPEDVCAQYFQQKLQRRIQDPIQAFDLLDIAASGANPPNQEQIRVQVGAIAAELKHIVAVIKHDRRHRWQGETDTVFQLASMMQAVCRRNYCPGDRFGPLGGTRSSNLFQLLIGNHSSGEAMFGLDALEVFSKEAIMEQSESLVMVRRLLVEQDAPQEYIRLFDNVTGRPVE